jgi:hypothetical protein
VFISRRFNMVKYSEEKSLLQLLVIYLTLCLICYINFDFFFFFLIVILFIIERYQQG